MCSSVDYWRCRWIKLGGALEYPQRGPSDPHPGPDLSTACPQGYPQGWREDPQGVENGTRRCGDAHICPSTEARSPPRRANRAVRIQVPVREGGAGSFSSAVAHRGAPTTPLAPGRAVGAVAVGAQPGTAPARSRAALSGRSRGGRSETGVCRRGDAPPPPHPGARPDRGARWWTSSECYRGPGSGRSRRASRLNADADRPRRLRRTRRERGPAQRGRGQAGGRRCTRGRRHTRPVRPVRLGAGTGGPVAERSGDSKRWPARIFHPPPRAPPIPKWRNDAIPRTRRSRRAPESHAPATFFRPADAPGRNGGAAGGLHRAQTVIGTGPAATAGVASRSPRGNHRTGPGGVGRDGTGPHGGTASRMS